MWSIHQVTVPNGEAFKIHHHVGGKLKPVELDEALGPEGEMYCVCIEKHGMVSLQDVGWDADSWAVKIDNSETWRYQGSGQMLIAINEDKTFTISGEGNQITRQILNDVMCDAAKTATDIVQATEGRPEDYEAWNKDPLAFLQSKGFPMDVLAHLGDQAKQDLIEELKKHKLPSGGEAAPQGWVACTACQVGMVTAIVADVVVIIAIIVASDGAAAAAAALMEEGILASLALLSSVPESAVAALAVRALEAGAAEFISKFAELLCTEMGACS